MGPAIDASPSVLRMIEVVGWLAGKIPSATRITHTLPLQNKVFYVKPLDGDGKGGSLHSLHQRVHSRYSVDLMGLISAALSSGEGHKRAVPGRAEDWSRANDYYDFNSQYQYSELVRSRECLFS